MAAAAAADGPPPPPPAPVVPFGASWATSPYSMETHGPRVLGMAWTKDGKGGKTVLFIASAAALCTIRVVDPETGECLRSKRLNMWAYSACAYDLADGTPVVAVGMHLGKISVVRVDTLEEHCAAQSYGTVAALAISTISPGRHVLASIEHGNGAVYVWNVGDVFEPLTTLRWYEVHGLGELSHARCVDVFAEEERVLVLHGLDYGAIVLSDKRRDEPVGMRIIARHATTVCSSVFLPRGGDEALRAMSASEDNVVRVWAVSDGAVLFEKSAWYPYRAVPVFALNSEGTEVPAVISSDREHFYLWQVDRDDGECCRVIHCGMWNARPAICGAQDGTLMIATADKHYMNIQKLLIRRTKRARPAAAVAEDKRARGAGAA
jgi:WD40 repeat protein